MFHKIKEIKTCDDLKLQAEFTNGVKKEYNVRNMFSVYEPMKELENPELFQKAHISPGGYAVIWSDQLDLDASDIWEDGVVIE